MMEFLAGLFIGMSGWFIFGGLILAALVLEHKECHGWTLFLGACALLGGKFLFGLSWDIIGYAVLAYLPIGFIWSFWRWRRRCGKLVRNFEQDPGRYSLSGMKDKVDVKSNIGLIVMWIFIWPFSILESFIGDLIDIVEKFVRSIAKATYERWSNDAIAKMEVIAENREK